MFVDAKTIWEALLDSLREGDGSEPAKVIAYMDANPVLIAYVSPDEDHWLQAVRAIAAIAEPDVLVWTFEGWRAMTPTKADGTPWGRGEIEYAKLNNTEDAERVKDGFVLMMVDRLGNVATGSATFEVKNEKVQILDEMFTDDSVSDDKEAQWWMIDAGREAMLHETVSQAMKFLRGGDEDQREEMYALQLIALAKTILLPMGVPVGLGTASERVKDLWIESLERDSDKFHFEQINIKGGSDD